MSLNQIIYEGIGDTIDNTLNLKANSIQVKGNINVPFINGVPYVGGSVNVGNPRDILQTNAAGTNPEWTSDIKIDDIEIDGQITLGSSTGTNGQVIIKSAGNPRWGSPSITLPSIPVGPADSVLITNGASTVAWSKDIDINNCDINQQLSFNGSSGTNGQVIIKSGGLPVWSTPTFTLPSIPTGTPRQLLQTNAAGTSAEWTSNIRVIDEDITGNLSTNGYSGATGDTIVKSGLGQSWGKISNTAINPGTANYILETNSSGTAAIWSNTITATDPKFSGNMTLNGNTGVSNQFIKKNGSSQNWSYILQSDISPGLANQALLTNSSGTASGWRYINEQSIEPLTSTAKQVLTVNNTNTGTLWSFVNPDSIQPGALNQVLVTNGSGNVVWTNYPASPITPGTAYQILQTNAAASAVEWTSQFRGTSVLFNSANQTALSRYFEGTATLPIYLVPQGGSTRHLQSVSASVQYIIIGRQVTVTVYPFTISLPVSAPFGSYYIALAINNNLIEPATLQSPSNTFQMSAMCSCSNFSTINPEPSFANVYSNYYSFGAPYIELALSSTRTYSPSGNHGGLFQYPNNSTEFMQLTAPFSITYIIN